MPPKDLLHEPGPDSSRWRPARLVTLVALAVLALAGGAYDLQARSAASDRLDRCAEEVAAGVAAGRDAVAGMVAYVRPAMRDDVRDAVRESMYRLVSRAARRAERSPLPAAATCEGVRTLPWHDALERRRTACSAVLEQHEAFLRVVAEDGRQAFSGRWPPAEC